MLECKKAHGSSADVGHQVLMWVTRYWCTWEAEKSCSTEAGLWEHGWLKTVEPKGKEALVSGQGSIVPITVGTQQMDV